MTNIRAAFAAILAALTLLTAAPALAEPVILKRGNNAEPDSLDPQKATGQWENNIIGDMIVGLMTDDAKGAPIYGVAESYTVSDDGLVWTFKLRPDAVWSDGVPVTAGDFVFALQRINDPKTQSQYVTLTHVIKNAAAVFAGTMTPDQIGAKAIDDHTLELTLEHPAPYLPSQLTHYAMFPVPKHVIDKVGDDWAKPENFVGNGPFMLKEWRPNEYVRSVKNPKFYDAANVKIDEVYYYSQEDQIANVKRFRAGEYDISIGVPSQLLAELKRTMPDELRVAQAVTVWYVVFNLKREIWKDPRVRLALGLAIDRETIAEKIMGAGETPAYALVPPLIPDYPHTAQLDYAKMSLRDRQAKARELLKAAGYGPKNPLSFEFLHMQSTDAKRIGASLQTMWRDIGVNMTPNGSETKIVYNNLRAQNYDVGLAGWLADFPDASNYLYLAETSSDEMNYSKYSNAKFDQLNIDADNEKDGAKRAEILTEAEQILLDDAPMVPIYFAVSRNLVATYVKGFENSPTNLHRTRWMSIDKTQQAAVAADKAKADAPPVEVASADTAPPPAAEPGPPAKKFSWFWWYATGAAIFAYAAYATWRRYRLTAA